MVFEQDGLGGTPGWLKPSRRADNYEGFFLKVLQG
jgi:hypothetical protein